MNKMRMGLTAPPGDVDFLGYMDGLHAAAHEVSEYLKTDLDHYRQEAGQNELVDLADTLLWTLRAWETQRDRFLHEAKQRGAPR